MDAITGGAARGKTVAVSGATGHTGRFVVRELLRRGFTPVAIGRDAERLAAAVPAGVARRTADLADPAGLAAALVGAAAVINCAGPFLDTAEPLLAAALAARIHYLDVTAEQASALASFDHHAAAEAANVTVIPAMGFYGGLADLLVSAAAGDWTAVDEVRIGIALDSWRPTAGTRATGRRNTAPRLTLAGGRLQPLGDPAPAPPWPFAGPFGAQEMVELPFTEAVLIGRHLQVAQLHTYLNAAPLRDLRDPATAPPVASDASGRSAQTFRVEVEVCRGEAVRRAAAAGRDIYAVTAPLVVEALGRILNAAPSPGGVFAPGARLDAAAVLTALAPDIQWSSLVPPVAATPHLG